jgi:hypothetical protein
VAGGTGNNRKEETVSRCYNSTVVNASSTEVWRTIRNFHEVPWAEEVLTSCEKVGDVPGDQVGAKRVLNEAFHETLQSIDDDEREFTYTIDDGPGPVAKEVVQNYVGRVRVIPVTENDSSFVEWESNYRSADPDAVGEFCNPIYVALLVALKKYCT